MANTLLTISMITREALRVLENNLVFTKTVNRDYDDKFAIEGAKIGTVVNARKPPRYLGRTGQALQIENAAETSVPVALTTQFGVDIQFTSADLLLSIDDFSKRFIEPAIATVANKIDNDGLALYKSVANSVGTPGTIPNAYLTYSTAGALLAENATPMDDNLTMLIGPRMQATIVDALKGLFQSSEQIKQQYLRGRMGTAAGFEWAWTQNLNTHTVGPLGGTPLVNGANQTGSSLITDGWTAAAATRLKKGDVFTVANVNLVNPQTRMSTGQLAQFVVTADSASDGSGNLTIPIYPPIVASGAFQTVDSLPADNAALTIVGAANTQSPQGLAYHRDAFACVTADLPLPKGVDMAARVSDKQLGISVRMVRAYDINTDNFPCRLDVLYGWAALRPELACRIMS
jgi:hypothetical protein